MEKENYTNRQGDVPDHDGKEVTVWSSEITKDPEWLKKVNKKRKQYDRKSERFDAVEEFLFRYKNQDTPLSDDLKYLFKANNGQPMQDVLYSTLIFNLPVENWLSFSRRERNEMLFDCGSELYHYQRMLNKCIGRTYYNSAAIDKALLVHIRNEIVSRFPFMDSEDFSWMRENGIDYIEETFRRYTSTYLKSYEVEKGFQNSPGDLFVSEVQRHFQIHKKRGDHFIKDEKSCWLSLTGKRNKGGVSLFTSTMSDTFGRRLYPTKNDLFIFAIAVGLSYEEYQELVQKAVQDCGDPSRYAYNKTSTRDALILSVIRDLDGWYKGTTEDLRTSGEYPPLKVVDPMSICFAMEVLLRVDKMLWNNLYHRDQKPPVESLLYHNFLLDRGCQFYCREYKKWCGSHDADQVIEFQESIKEQFRADRIKELTR